MIRLLLVDDHPSIREGLLAIFSQDPDFQVIAEAESGEQALRLVRETSPDVVLLDLRLPAADGFATCASLLKARPGIRVVAFTAFTEKSLMTTAFAAGASGFVLKESSPALIREAVRAVASGQVFIDPHFGAAIIATALGVRQPGPYGLTAREIGVLRLFSTGLSNREIAERLGLSEETIRTHSRNLRRKLGAKDKAQAVARANREGILAE